LRDLKTDLHDILATMTDDFGALRGAKIFLTGGTGYIGKWLLEFICYANDAAGLNIKSTVLSRQPENFTKTAPHLANNPAITLIAGDVRNFSFPEGHFSHAIHAATDVIAPNPPLEMFDTIITGTRRFLDFCSVRQIPHALLLSSGAVYGPIPAAVALVPEDYNGVPDPTRTSSAYGIGKLASEWMGCAYAAESGMQFKIARIFAQVGPHLALDKQFAVGNFIGNALRSEPFLIKGDGTAHRSYMYPIDLVTWLLRILLRGESCRPYNVGSDQAITIHDLAHRVAAVARITMPVFDLRGVPDPKKQPERYVPDINRARTGLNLEITVSLDEAIRRTLEWYRRDQLQYVRD
jgi:nucleoside-diphosphate-sugar epimerase